jgi:tetratricopeptide (TPR) repeat protein
MHDIAMDANEKGDKSSAQKYMADAYEQFTRGIEYAEKTKETLEELENLIELAFLLDDAIVIFGAKKVPRYREALSKLEKALKRHANDKPLIHQFPVFEALLKLEQGAVALANGENTKSLNYYVAGYKELGALPGYGVARYKQHLPHLMHQIDTLPPKEQVRWCRRFIKVWKETPSGRRGKTLADDLIPDLVQWCNRLLINIDKSL